MYIYVYVCLYLYVSEHTQTHTQTHMCKPSAHAINYCIAQQNEQYLLLCKKKNKKIKLNKL